METIKVKRFSGYTIKFIDTTGGKVEEKIKNFSIDEAGTSKLYESAARKLIIKTDEKIDSCAIISLERNYEYFNVPFSAIEKFKITEDEFNKNSDSSDKEISKNDNKGGK